MISAGRRSAPYFNLQANQSPGCGATATWRRWVVSRRERDDPMTASVRRANADATKELLTA